MHLLSLAMSMYFCLQELAYILLRICSSPSCPGPFPLGYWSFSHTIANVLAANTHIIFYMPFSTCSQNQKNISDAFNPTFYLLQSAKLLIAICWCIEEHNKKCAISSGYLVSRVISTRTQWEHSLTIWVHVHRCFGNHPGRGVLTKS